VSYLLSKLKNFWIIKSMKKFITLCIKCSTIADYTSSVVRIFLVAVAFCCLLK